jgi:hypothetical protein
MVSTAATWVVKGLPGLEELEGLLKISSQDGLRRFHDGEKVLSEVLAWHDQLRSNISTDDSITGRMLDLTDDHLLQGNPALRFDSYQLCQRLDQLLQPTKQALHLEDSKTPTQLAFSSSVVQIEPTNPSLCNGMQESEGTDQGGLLSALVKNDAYDGVGSTLQTS